MTRKTILLYKCCRYSLLLMSLHWNCKGKKCFNENIVGMLSNKKREGNDKKKLVT